MASPPICEMGGPSSSASTLQEPLIASRTTDVRQDEEEAAPSYPWAPPNHSTDTLQLRQRANATARNTVFPQHEQQQQNQQPEEVSASRILDRDGAFFQSRGRWRVQHTSRDAATMHHTPTGETNRVSMWKLIWDDWFHNLAGQRTVVLMLILCVVYAATVFVFAFIYLGVSLLGEQDKVNPDGTVSKLPFCDMDIHDHMEALYFSLSTMTTIGYGVSDYYFGGCWTPLLLVLAQVCCALVFNAVAIGLIFQRISRGHKRSKTILFSDKAVVRRVKGVPYLMVRIGELRSHQLIEATVRAYCIRHERHAVVVESETLLSSSSSSSSSSPATPRTAIETTHFVTRPVRFLHEEAGSHILMSLPQVLVHRIDDRSPLCPPRPVWYDATGQMHGQVNSSSNNNLNNHSHQSTPATNMDDSARFLRDRQAEIVILVEGTDDLTGSAIQTRHSYTFQDLAWNETFVPCVYPYSSDRDGPGRWCGWFRRTPSTTPVCVVDFARFHDTEPAPVDCDGSCPYIME
jgi:hypothetical protein